MTSDPDCIFCRIVAQEIPSVRVYEDANTLAFMGHQSGCQWPYTGDSEAALAEFVRNAGCATWGCIINRAKGSGRYTESSKPGWCESHSREWVKVLHHRYRTFICTSFPEHLVII